MDERERTFWLRMLLWATSEALGVGKLAECMSDQCVVYNQLTMRLVLISRAHGFTTRSDIGPAREASDVP